MVVNYYYKVVGNKINNEYHYQQKLMGGPGPCRPPLRYAPVPNTCTHLQNEGSRMGTIKKHLQIGL